MQHPRQLLSGGREPAAQPGPHSLRCRGCCVMGCGKAREPHRWAASTPPPPVGESCGAKPHCPPRSVAHGGQGCGAKPLCRGCRRCPALCAASKSRARPTGRSYRPQTTAVAMQVTKFETSWRFFCSSSHFDFFSIFFDFFSTCGNECGKLTRFSTSFHTAKVFCLPLPQKNFPPCQKLSVS